VKVVAGWVAAVLAVIGLAVGILAAIGVGQPVHVAIRPVTRPKTPTPIGPMDLAPVEVIVSATASLTPAPVKPAPPLSDAYSTSLRIAVAAGTSRTVTFRVPAHKAFDLDSIVLDTVGSGRGVASVQMLVPGAQMQTLDIQDLAKLSAQPEISIRLQTPIVFDAGDSLGLNVTCQGHEACDVGLLVTGFLVKA
jgi:hypothetical protein